MKHSYKIIGTILFLISTQLAFAEYSITPNVNNFVLAPGKNIQGTATITNDSSKDVMLKIYAADGSKTLQGGFAISLENEIQKNMGLWIKPEVSTLSLTPNQKKDLAFTITVPKDTAAGDYAGGIAIQEIDAKTQQEIKNSARSVSPLFVSVEGEKKYGLDFESFKYNDKTPDRIGFELKLKDTGNTKIKATAVITIEELWGLKKYTLPQKDLILYGGEETTSVIKWDKNPFLGIFKATMQIKTEPDQGKLEKSLNFTVIKWDKILIGIGIIIIITLLIYFKRKK